VQSLRVVDLFGVDPVVDQQFSEESGGTF